MVVLKGAAVGFRGYDLWLWLWPMVSRGPNSGAISVAIISKALISGAISGNILGIHSSILGGLFPLTFLVVSCLNI